MRTLRLFAGNPPEVPMATVWYLADLAAPVREKRARHQRHHGKTLMIPKDHKRLTEANSPIAEVSRHAAREESIRHGHPSTLHLLPYAPQERNNSRKE